MADSVKLSEPMNALAQELVKSRRSASMDDVVEVGHASLANEGSRLRNVQELIQEGLDAAQNGDVWTFASNDDAVDHVMKLGRDG